MANAETKSSEPHSEPSQTGYLSPWTQDVNWMCIRRLEASGTSSERYVYVTTCA